MTLLHCVESGYGGWSRGLRVSTDAVELWITLEVGPRILRCQRRNEPSLFYENAEQLGNHGEASFRLRGGHRFWTAPESALTYEPDNTSVDYQVRGDSVELIATPRFGLRKTIVIEALTPSVFRIRHGLCNVSSEAMERSPWALSVMAPGGVAYLPQPTLRSHPSALPSGTPWRDEDLLPNRRLVLWPYTDLGDPRLKLTGRLWSVEQRGDLPPLKLGLYDASEGLAGLGCVVCYQLGSSVFVKTVPMAAGRELPDLGAGFELYTDGNFLELETLGPLQRLLPDESIWHEELWLISSSERPLGEESVGLAFLTEALHTLVRAQSRRPSDEHARHPR